jgi:hypothetical protein
MTRQEQFKPRVPSIEELTDLNKRIPRRLWQPAKDARLVGDPQVICASEVDFPYGIVGSVVGNERRPYHFYDSDKHNGYALTFWEAKLVLGEDLSEPICTYQINACLKAIEGLLVGANAYLLGTSNMGIHRDNNFRVYPVNYYKIPKRVHSQMRISDERLKNLTEIILGERKTK